MKPLDIGAAVKAISSVLPERRPIEHHEPVINGAEASHLLDCVNRGITGYHHIKLMEEKLRAVTGAEQALLVSSGTCALQLALQAAGIQPGDEVLVPALTFAATAAAVVHAGAAPNFVDGSININPYKLRCYLARETEKGVMPHRTASGNNDNATPARVNKRTGRPVRALIVVHLLGIPAEMAALTQLAQEFGLILIEDAAQALGSMVGNQACGSFGAASAISFNCNKIVTTGGGGALLCNDPWVAAKAFQLACTARIPHPWLIGHDAIAYNYRMPSVAAAVGCAQLEQLSDFVAKKRTLQRRYRDGLQSIPGLRLVEHPEQSNYWLTTVLVEDPADRDRLLAALHKQGIKARALFTPLHQLPCYSEFPRDNNLGYAEDTFRRAVSLPSGAGLC